MHVEKKYLARQSKRGFFNYLSTRALPMLFNTYIFIFGFLPIMFFGYFWLLKQRVVLLSKLWLVGGSLVFYGYWNVAYVPLLLASILVNFYIGSYLSKSASPSTNKSVSSIKNRIINILSAKRILILGLVFNIGLLAYFKYTDFLIININSALGTELELLHIILPLGISFFTITQIAFLIDSYEGLAKEYSLINYMLFTTYFPHLLAGPILHHKEMMPQFTNRWNWALKWSNIAKGLFIFSIGLFKKAIIADSFSVWINTGFHSVSTLNLFAAWAVSLGNTLQIYFDFSGYTDMAIGMSLLFNIKLPINFNSPYKALSLIEFWQRWHITLSRFITSYIYTPLIRSFKQLTFAKAMLATFITMLIAGVWHGANWGFVVFGGFHGIGLIINNYWRKTKIKQNSILSWFLTFNFINIADVFFSAPDIATANALLFNMFAIKHAVFSINFLEILSMWVDYPLFKLLPYSTNTPTVNEMALIYGLLAIPFCLFLKNSSQYLEQKLTLPKALIASSAFTYSMIKSLFVSSQVFLYFNF